jgi:U3 small nucleolar RNA-associated protein 13
LETTLDNHTDRVWALATPFQLYDRLGSNSSVEISDYALISGSADATVTFWVDKTSVALSAAVTANSARIEQDQQLQNYIHAGSYREAITLALQLNHPGRLLSLFTAAMDTCLDGDGQESLTGNPAIDTVLQSLDPDNLYTLLLRVRDWNTNARTSRVAQRILYALSKSYPPSTFVALATRHRELPPSAGNGGKSSTSEGIKEVLDALTAYTERHYKRIEDLIDESYLVEWILSEMDGGLSSKVIGSETGSQSRNDVSILGT